VALQERQVWFPGEAQAATYPSEGNRTQPQYDSKHRMVMEKLKNGRIKTLKKEQYESF
jgi:hypothetical protein